MVIKFRHISEFTSWLPLFISFRCCTVDQIYNAINSHRMNQHELIYTTDTCDSISYTFRLYNNLTERKVVELEVECLTNDSSEYPIGVKMTNCLTGEVEHI